MDMSEACQRARQGAHDEERDPFPLDREKRHSYQGQTYHADYETFGECVISMRKSEEGRGGGKEEKARSREGDEGHFWALRLAGMVVGVMLASYGSLADPGGTIQIGGMILFICGSAPGIMRFYRQDLN